MLKRGVLHSEQEACPMFEAPVGSSPINGGDADGPRPENPGGLPRKNGRSTT